uniref:Cadherin domain-containing protein n=1 Tax=Macrostomum lignano TaxID=282301 RepID=A0A1I8F1L7_9PLAT
LGSHAEYVDRVLFDVTARGAPSLERQELRIVISDRHINRFNQRLLLNMNPLTVLEGGNVSLTVRNIDGASFARLMPTNVLLFVITELPKYGIFTFSGNNISIGDTFVRDDLVKANLVYYHDGSDTEVDELGFYVREQTDSQLTPQSMAKQPAVLRIQVTPVNDQIFKVDRMNSVVKVLRGRFVKIGPDQLSVIDQDSQSEQIVYRVRRSPTFGQLRINSRACLSFPRAPEEPTCEFSQADVNAGQVVYLHLGNNGSLDSFYFCVSDSFSQPEHKPFCQTFEIHVSPVSITFLSTHDLLIRQGYNSATLTPVQLNASCNDPQDPIWYTVTRTPEYGQLYRDKLGVFNFSQADVDKGLIRYQLTRFVSSLDSMQQISLSCQLVESERGQRLPCDTSRVPGYEAPTRYRIVKQAVNALISPASFTQSDIDAGAVQAVGLVAEIEVTTPLANVAPGAFNLTVRLVLCQGQNASEARGKEFTNSEDDAARVLGLSRTNFVTLVLVCGVVLLAAVLLVLVRVIPQRLAKAAAANGRRQADSQVVEKPDTSQLYGSGSNGGSCNGGATLSSSSSRMQALPIVPESILKPKPLVSVASAGYYDTRSLASNHSHNASYRSIPGAKSASISNLSPGQQHLQAQLTPPPPPPPPPPPVQTISTATRHVAFDPHPRVENLSPPASLRQAGGGRSSKSSSPFRDNRFEGMSTRRLGCRPDLLVDWTNLRVQCMFMYWLRAYLGIRWV